MCYLTLSMIQHFISCVIGKHIKVNFTASSAEHAILYSKVDHIVSPIAVITVSIIQTCN